MEKREAGPVLGFPDARSSDTRARKPGDQLTGAGQPHVCRVEAYGAKVVALASGFCEARPIPSITSVGAALAVVAYGELERLSTIDPLRHSQLATPVDTTALWCHAGQPATPLKCGLPRVSGTDPLRIPRRGSVIFAIAVWCGSTGHALGTSSVVVAVSAGGVVFDACVAASITPLEPPSTRVPAQLDCAVIRGDSDLFRESVETEFDSRAYLRAGVRGRCTEPVLLLPVTQVLQSSLEIATGDIIIASGDPYSTAACTVRCEP